MKSLKKQYRKGNPKKGSYKPKSRKRHLCKARSCIQSPTHLLKDKMNLDINNTSAHSFRKKKFEGLYINHLPMYKKAGRSRYLIKLEQLLPFKAYKPNTKRVIGLMALSFLISPEYLQNLYVYHTPK